MEKSLFVLDKKAKTKKPVQETKTDPAKLILHPSLRKSEEMIKRFLSGEKLAGLKVINSLPINDDPNQKVKVFLICHKAMDDVLFDPEFLNAGTLIRFSNPTYIDPYRNAFRSLIPIDQPGKDKVFRPYDMTSRKSNDGRLLYQIKSGSLNVVNSCRVTLREFGLAMSILIDAGYEVFKKSI